LIGPIHPRGIVSEGAMTMTTAITIDRDESKMMIFDGFGYSPPALKGYT
jgi:hypothetical protein